MSYTFPHTLPFLGTGCPCFKKHIIFFFFFFFFQLIFFFFLLSLQSQSLQLTEILKVTSSSFSMSLCHFTWFYFLVSGQLSTTVSEGAQGICHFTCCYNVSLLAVVHHSLWLGSDRSSRSDIFLFVCLQVTSLAQGICHFTCILFKFSHWAVVHHSLWEVDRNNPFLSRLSGSPWTV